ncbi:MAG: hypothetical protein ACI9CQ_003068, partial [Saprospiraceae bacterium]
MRARYFFLLLILITNCCTLFAQDSNSTYEASTNNIRFRAIAEIGFLGVI